jgi:hypothetical protein
MMRIFFWILVAFGLAAFFFAAAHQRSMTNEENTLLWGSIGCGVMAVFAFGSAAMLIYCWKKGVAIMVGYYGRSRWHARDSQPLRYWCIMLFYLLALLICSSLAILVGLILLPILQKQLSH